jgi:hypothetical protein
MIALLTGNAAYSRRPLGEAFRAHQEVLEPGAYGKIVLVT